MDELNAPKCSHDADVVPQQNTQPLLLNMANMPLDTQSKSIPDENNQMNIPKPSINMPNSSKTDFPPNNSGVSIIIRPSMEAPIINQPHVSNLSMVVTTPNQPQRPQSLFLQALSKLNETSRSFCVINHIQSNMDRFGVFDWRSGDITPPGSLTSAPPSYSFVLRQMAARRRPRLMGTFFPSPSFVQQTPPPTYATAFDVYIDPGPPPPPRVYNYGFTSMPVVCPECGFAGMTITTSKVTICTHLCALILCLFCCWICAPLPYLLRSCKDVYHYCRNCRHYLGMYCPTNSENSVPTR